MSVIHLKDYQPTQDDLEEMEVNFIATQAAQLRQDVAANPAIYAKHKDMLLEASFQICAALDEIEQCQS